MFTLVSFAVSYIFVRTCLSDEAPFYADFEYNQGHYGKYVTQTFKSNPEVTGVPVMNFMKPFTDCDDGSYIFLTPRGEMAPSTPMIVDITGSPVWASTQRYGEVYNLQVQNYWDESFLTFWGGNDAVDGHGIGTYFMLDQHYHERYRITAANGLDADLHAFTLTSDHTALITIYAIAIAHMNSVAGHHRKGFIWDSLFQEVDLDSGQAIFEWRASKHIDVSNSYTEIGAATESDPWDAYHINSVEKDDLGNFLISIRFLRAVLYIDGRTGKVLWQLGGKKNSFRDLSDGEATILLGQHDAHWQDGHKYITLFDNRASWYADIDVESKGKRIAVDLEAMTARADAVFVDPNTKILSTSQGSYQTLSNGNVLLGYGFNGAFAEFSESGELLCSAYYQPSSAFGSGDVQSYRNLKFNWTAYPDSAPALVLDGDTLYFSWNGATEVDIWLLLGSSTGERDSLSPDSLQTRGVEDAIVVPRMGFETKYHIIADEGMERFVRVMALDKDGKPLGVSDMVDIKGLANEKVSGGYHGLIGEDDRTVLPEVGNSHDNLRPRIRDHNILIGFGLMAGFSIIMIAALVVDKRGLLSSLHVMAGSSSHHGKVEPADVMRHKYGSGIADVLQCVREVIPGGWRRGRLADSVSHAGLLLPRDFMSDSESRRESLEVFHTPNGISRCGRQEP